MKKLERKYSKRSSARAAHIHFRVDDLQLTVSRVSSAEIQPSIFADDSPCAIRYQIISRSILSFNCRICPMRSDASLVVMLAAITARLTPQALPKAVFDGTRSQYFGQRDPVGLKTTLSLATCSSGIHLGQVFASDLTYRIHMAHSCLLRAEEDVEC